jgi:hypothetical protein
VNAESQIAQLKKENRRLQVTILLKF